MKICSTCKVTKSFDAFNKRSLSKDGHHSQCKECRKQIRTNDPDKFEKGRQKYIRNRNRLGTAVNEYLLTHPCVDCGEADPVVLEFDHLRDKFLPISRMVNYAYSLDSIMLEISKCEVRCCNCHRRITAKRGKWKSYLDTR